MTEIRYLLIVVSWLYASGAIPALAQRTTNTENYRVLKQKLDAIPAIDTHDHLLPFDRLIARRETADGPGVNLAGLWQNSYISRSIKVTPWTEGMEFGDWWGQAKDDFDNVRATSFFRYQLSAYKDLYGVDFEKMTDAEAKQLDRRIFNNYQDQKWIYEVVTEKANIELMFNDPYWNRYGFEISYPWEVLVFNVTPLVRGFHPSETEPDSNSPFAFAEKHGLPTETLDDYLTVLDRMFLEAKDHGAVCLKSTLAYQRTLDFANVERARAEMAYGKRASVLSAAEIKDFEDFIMWQLVKRSAQYDLPFQIHTGNARVQGSNPMLLLDMIEANPKTNFILFHGGYPWVGETGAIVMRHHNHVWVDSVWLPMISYTMAKRAFHEWLEVMPSNRIMWGADCNHAEGIYGATEFTRRCLAEVLAEKVEQNDLTIEQAEHIGRQILRDNALELFPQLEARLWKHRGKKMIPPETHKSSE